MSPLLAVDAGGTSSRALILDEHGRCIGYGRAGGGNPISSGPQRAAAAVVAATRGALGQATAVLDPPRSPHAFDLTLGLIAMAGARTYSPTEWITSELEPFGLLGTVVIESDLLAAFCSAGPELDGYAIVAGTGACAVRVQGGRVAAAADGLGWLLGDAGSGYWIGHAAVLAAVSTLDGRAPGTALVPLVLTALGIQETAERTADGRPQALADTVDRLYAMRPIQLAEFAPLAFAAAEQGDTIAAHILVEAQRSIVETLAAVSDPAVHGPAVLGGGVLARFDELPDQIAASQRALGHEPDVRRVQDGIVGAAVLALRAAGISVDDAVFATIVRSLAELR